MSRKDYLLILECLKNCYVMENGEEWRSAIRVVADVLGDAFLENNERFDKIKFTQTFYRSEQNEL